MATIITMPRLSDTMEEGTVASWLKSVGDTVGEGDILAEIETDKATMEFESFHEGTLLYIGIAEGETANVDALLAIIGEKGEDISMHLNPSTSQTAPDTVSHQDTQQTKEVAPTAEAAAIPEGVEVITMPRLSDTMEEGTVATWLKKEGDSIQEGDILAEIETDKATMEFESFYTGTLLKIGIQEGETALVDALLAIVGPAGTDVSGISQSYESGCNSCNTCSQLQYTTSSKRDTCSGTCYPSGEQRLRLQIPHHKEYLLLHLLKKWQLIRVFHCSL